MPAAEPVDFQAYRHVGVGGLHLRCVERHVDIDPGRPAYAQASPFLGVEVEQNEPVKHARGESRSAAHASLLLTSDKDLERAVWHGAIRQDRERGRHANAVISPEGCTRGHNGPVDNTRHDRVFKEVVREVVILLRHHVDMGLEDYGHAVLKSRRGLGAYDDVAAIADDLVA